MKSIILSLLACFITYFKPCLAQSFDLQSKVIASDRAYNDQLGTFSAVSIDGNHAVAGAQ